jgi:hypothetical protein
LSAIAAHQPSFWPRFKQTTKETYRMKKSAVVGSFKDALARSNPRVKQLANALRKLIREVCPEVVEVPWSRQQIIGYGVGSKKMTEHFCYIAPYGEHVNVGFNFGLALPDPDQLMEGAGKNFRHIKIRKLEDVDHPGLRKLLHAAVRERKRALHKHIAAP